MFDWLRRLRNKPKASDFAQKPKPRVVGKSPLLAAPYGSAAKHDDPGFDAAGFALGIATGVPISPSQGISYGSMLGAALHSNSHAAATPPHAYDPPAPSSPSCDTSSSSSSYDSSSSSSCSSDSGISSSGGGDSGGSF